MYYDLIKLFIEHILKEICNSKNFKKDLELKLEY